MRKTLDDIDEDEPAPIVVAPSPAAGGSGSGNASVMDDLFGPSSASPVQPAVQQSQQQSAAPAKPADVLDDFFGQPPASSTNGGGSQPQPSQPSAKTHDVFDALFVSGGGNSSSSSSQPNQHGQPQQAPQSQPQSQASPASPFGAAAPKPTRSAIDQLAAFSATMSGGAAPWVDTTTVAASAPMDSTGASAATRVFVPPDSVLSLMTLYDVVGAAPGWAIEDIARAYKKKALALHPDKLQGGRRTDAEDRYFKIITAAYDVLKDAEKRAEYDAALKGGANTGSGSWLDFVA